MARKLFGWKEEYPLKANGGPNLHTHLKEGEEWVPFWVVGGNDDGIGLGQEWEPAGKQ
jgi:hypothetical protein